MSGGRWVGRPVKRREDLRLLTGQGNFIDTVTLPNLHHAAILRSPHAHARIVRIDASRARAHGDVTEVLSGEDVGRMSDPFANIAAPIRYYSAAVGVARFVGEPVAVVIARDRYVAEDALDLIDVEYEPLPVVLDQEAAMQPGAPLLHPEIGTNVAVRRQFRFGDTDRAFAEADLVVAERLRFPRYSHFPIETYGVVARFDAVSRMLTLWANFQGPFIIHTVVARALRLPQHRVRIIVPGDIGGGFGLKSSVYPYMTLIGLAAMKAGVPVKWIEDRRENLTASSSHADRVSYMEAAVKRDGTIVAVRNRSIDNVGAYLRTPEPANLFARFSAMSGAYRFRHFDLDLAAVMSNTSLTGPVRGYGGQTLFFGLERLVDLIATRLGLDPLEVRRRNFIRREEFPYTTPTGGVYDSGDYHACLDRLARLARYDELRARQREAQAAGRLLGIGLATTIDPCVTNIGYIELAKTREERARRRPMSGSAEGGTVMIDPNGGVTAVATTVPQGQGHETVIAQVVADELGVEPEEITVTAQFDTFSSPWSITSGSYSSRFSSVGASAYAGAARMVRAKALKIAAHALEVAEEDLEWKDGAARVKGVPDRVLGLRAIAGIAHWNPAALPPGLEANLQATCVFNLPTARPAAADDTVNSQNVYGFASELAVVEIDPRNGVVHVLEYYAVHDCGTVLNPAIVRGQIQGAAVQGISGALLERMAWDEHGQYLTASFQDYLIPTAMEAPPIAMDHLETPSPHTVLGSKGVGEASSMCAPVTIANAVADALAPLQVPVTELPLWPEALWRAIREARGT